MCNSGITVGAKKRVTPRHPPTAPVVSGISGREASCSQFLKNQFSCTHFKGCSWKSFDTCTHLCNHHLSQGTESSLHPQKILCAPSQAVSLYSQLQAFLDSLLPSCVSQWTSAATFPGLGVWEKLLE